VTIIGYWCKFLLESSIFPQKARHGPLRVLLTLGVLLVEPATHTIAYVPMNSFQQLLQNKYWLTQLHMYVPYRVKMSAKLGLPPTRAIGNGSDAAYTLRSYLYLSIVGLVVLLVHQLFVYNTSAFLFRPSVLQPVAAPSRYDGKLFLYASHMCTSISSDVQVPTTSFYHLEGRLLLSVKGGVIRFLFWG